MSLFRMCKRVESRTSEKNRKIQFAPRILTAHKNNILSTYLEPYFTRL